MERGDFFYQAFTKILQEELVPAMGCTEPIALAYAAARARDVLGTLPERAVVQASGSIIKNVKSVIVPNTNQLKGIPAAVCAGIIAGDADSELEVLADVSSEKIGQIKTYMDTTDVQVLYLDSGLTFDLIVTVFAGSDHAKVRISNSHTNIVLIERNHEILFETPVNGENEEGFTDRSVLSVEKIWDYITCLDVRDVRDLLKRQIEYNTAIAEEGLRGNYGANIGQVLLASCGDDIKIRAKAKAAAGSDARMNGCELPVIINSGSGNQGITCCVPVVEYARELGADEDTLYRALALSNLVSIHIKTGIGRLSAYCGAVSAGAAAGAGIAYLCGGGYPSVTHTIVNALGIVSGIICDGAKASCAGKIAAAVDAGILGYHMYQHGQQLRSGDGIVAKGIEANIRNIGRLGKEGMRETNKEIMHIMMGE
ncbi:MAG: L-serine ammonia-lyase, iron-sulfur-dependent, subunit alpha [Eubacteriales bacterium]|nr:L-serine ammonia-lyase, iron-sulfur-dependent, subunit alpha [Eubacteriales bacterium]